LTIYRNDRSSRHMGTQTTLSSDTVQRLLLHCIGSLSLYYAGYTLDSPYACPCTTDRHNALLRSPINSTQHALAPREKREHVLPRTRAQALLRRVTGSQSHSSTLLKNRPGRATQTQEHAARILLRLNPITHTLACTLREASPHPLPAREWWS